jgi:hypothetical protein
MRFESRLGSGEQPTTAHVRVPRRIRGIASVSAPMLMSLALTNVPGMEESHRHRVERLLSDAAQDHQRLLGQLPAEIASSLPVDAQGITRAIDHIADAIGFTPGERRDLVRPHAVNPAVLHARVFGPTGLTQETVVGAFVDGARVRADTLVELADAVGGEPLGTEVRKILTNHPPPVDAADADVTAALRETYSAQEHAAKLIAAVLDAV